MRNTKLPVLIAMHSDFTEHYKKIISRDYKPQELEEDMRMILLSQNEIRSRCHLLWENIISKIKLSLSTK